jgi:hypothetical protein
MKTIESKEPMAQEDRGLVLRGLILLGAISLLVAGVLGFIFWRGKTPPPSVDVPPEHFVSSVVTPPLGDFPAGISWYAVLQLGETMPSAPGWEVRYNAATTLARRGSDAVPWPLLEEMLNEKLQMRNYRVRNADGRDVYDEAAARANMVSALRAVAAWHEKRKEQSNRVAPPELLAIYVTVDGLASSDIAELRSQAEKARSTFFR